MKSFHIIALAAIVLCSTSVAFVAAESGEKEPKLSVPRYSDTCAHGHNGFDCKPSSYRVDITDLQERVTALERASRP